MFSGVLLIISLVSVERAAANDSSTPNSAQNGNNNEFGNQLLKFQHQSCLAPLTNLNMHVPLFSPHIPSLPQSLIYTVISRVYSTSSCSPFQLPDELWIHHQPDNTLWLHGFQCSVTTLIFPLFYFIYLPITFSQELWEDTEHAELSGVQGQLPHCRWLSDHTVIKEKPVLLTVEEFSRWIFVFINLIFTQIFLVFLRKFTAFYYWVIFWSNFAFPVACGTTKIFASAVYVGMFINIDICTITYVGVSRLYSFGGNIQNYKRANSVVKRHVLTGTWCNSSLWSLLWPYANHIISGNILIFLVSDCEATF